MLIAFACAKGPPKGCRTCWRYSGIDRDIQNIFKTTFWVLMEKKMRDFRNAAPHLPEVLEHDIQLARLGGELLPLQLLPCTRSS